MAGPTYIGSGITGENLESKYPFFSMEEYGEMNLDEVVQWVKENIRDNFTDEIEAEVERELKLKEKAAVNYVTGLMTSLIASQTQTELFNDLAETGSFNFDKSQLRRGLTELGTFFEENIFGLPRFSQYKSNTPKPDFWQIQTELKTQKSGGQVDVTVAQTGVQGPKIFAEKGEYPEDVMNELKSRLEDSEKLRALAIYKMWYKMQNFLFLRLKKEKPIKSRVDRYHVMAMVLFFDLIMKKVIDIVDQNIESNIRINVVKKIDKKRPDELTGWSPRIDQGQWFSRTYEIKLRTIGVGTQDIAGQLNEIGKLYAQRHDFINE